MKGWIKMEKDMQNLLINIYSNMNNIFREDDDREPVMAIKIEDIDENFFTAELMALKMQFENLTQQQVDLIEFTHILNKLAVQYLLENNVVAEYSQF
ncbi:hypothetical protein [Clostridium paraputrificum]|uniref:hypothetical protein n=2 Tax=Clostridium TaxID=1485 RepID=UPI0023301C76|nr:hypothetical protein [Clostridium paraputrificum]MDB2121179.1 hypothetical protein [Clostridium paraputrificum]